MKRPGRQPWSALSKVQKRRIIAQRFPTHGNVARLKLVEEKSRRKPPILEVLGVRKNTELLGEKMAMRGEISKQIIRQINVPVLLEQEYFRLPEGFSKMDKQLRMWNVAYSRLLQLESIHPDARKKLKKLLFSRAWLHVMASTTHTRLPIPLKRIISARTEFIDALRLQRGRVIRESKKESSATTKEVYRRQEEKLTDTINQLTKELTGLQKISRFLYDAPETSNFGMYQSALGSQWQLTTVLSKQQLHTLWKLDDVVEEWINKKEDVRYRWGE